MPLKEQIDAENIVIREIGADELTLDEFTYRVRSEVETEDAEIIMIDGITGYKQAFDEDTIDADNRLIKIGQYLRNMNVTGIVTNEVHQITGDFRATDQNISHLADDIIFLRHVEYKGELQKVIGVLKRRTSDFETTLRRLAITEEGLEVGEPLSELRRILTGTPDWNDD